MNRPNTKNLNQGHRVESALGQEINERLSYQQLLNRNHDFTKENALLKNIAKKLGEELRNLHTQFDIRPREENTELYTAIIEHPHLQSYEDSLIPLLDTYEYKIQEFEHSFEVLHQEFFSLEKKFGEVCRENQTLNIRLTDARKELMDIYRNGTSEAMHSDFGQIILQQVNEKQKLLVEENAMLERDYQRYRAESEKSKSELEALKSRLEEAKGKIRDFDISQKQMELEISNLKEASFDLQIKVNEIEGEKRKLEQAHERAQSQNSTLNKEKEMYRNKLEEFRSKIEKENQVPADSKHKKFIEQLQTKIAFLEAEKGPSDAHKKLAKLQKEYDSLSKEKSRLKEALDGAKLREDELSETLTEYRERIATLESEKTALELTENKLKRTQETLAEKSKGEIRQAKKSAEEELERKQSEWQRILDRKDAQIHDCQEQLEKLALEKEKNEREFQISGKGDKQKISKDSDRALAKLKEKMAINEELFKEQIQIFENDLAFLKRENDSTRGENKEKSEELRKVKGEHEVLLKQHEEVCREKAALLEEFRKVRDEYELHLKDKERLFEEKIREIKAVVQDSDSRRRGERERVQEATREYKKVLEDIRQTYEARIRELESSNPGASLTRQRADTYTPGY